MALHYRYRFDPAGLAASEREALRTSAEAWLGEHPVALIAPDPIVLELRR
jgi:hypothetical protein